MCVKISYASRNSFARVPFWPKFWLHLPQLPDESPVKSTAFDKLTCVANSVHVGYLCLYVCVCVGVWLGLCMIYKSSETLCLPQWPRMRRQAPSCHSHLLQLQCNSHKCGQSCHQQEFEQKLKTAFSSERIHRMRMYFWY